jgi:hypothetical protein
MVKADRLDAALEAARTFVAYTAIQTGTLWYESWRSTDRPSSCT